MPHSQINKVLELKKKKKATHEKAFVFNASQSEDKTKMDVITLLVPSVNTFDT